LVLLLLSNSSLALEILTHDGHQHAAPHSSEMAGHALHGMSEMELSSTMSKDSAHGSDDCVCDDICCLSSIGFGLAATDAQSVSDAKSQVINPNFYLSISLDLFLPPPTS
jgi:hypothetical protein